MNENKRFENENILPDETTLFKDDQKLENDVTVLKKQMPIVKKIRIVIILIIALLLGVLLISYGQKINIDNMRRLFVKIQYNFSTDKTPLGTFDFKDSEDKKIISYKDGIAVLSGGSLTVYDDRGYKLSENDAVYKTPMLSSSGKYILSYDLGGDALKISNSFETVFEYKSDKAITYASIGKGNHLAVVSYADDYKNKVTVFDTAFSEIYTFYQYDRYITAAETSPDNKTLAIITVSPSGAEMKGELLLYKYKTTESYFSYDFGEEFPHTLFYKENGTICVITDKSIVFFSKEGKELSRLSIDGKRILSVSQNNSKLTAIAIAPENSNQTEITVFSDNGEAVLKHKTEENVSVSVSNNVLWGITQTNYFSTNISDGKTVVYPQNEFEKIVASGQNVFLIKSGAGKVNEVKK